MHAKSDKSSTAASRLRDECWQAMDHLRDALDQTPQYSPQNRELLEIIRRLAHFIDATASSDRGR
jgi:hypothetical protein